MRKWTDLFERLGEKHGMITELMKMLETAVSVNNEWERHKEPVAWQLTGKAEHLM